MTQAEIFSDWLAGSGYSRAEFARLLGVSRSLVTYWCNGRRKPNPKHASIIRGLSGGKVAERGWRYMDAPTAAGLSLQELIHKYGYTVPEAATQWGVGRRALNDLIDGRIGTKAGERVLDEVARHTGIYFTLSDFRADPA